MEKAKDAAWVARETSKAAKIASYERGVLKTEARLVEEVAGMCRDYCVETWTEALNQVGVPADSELRRVENIFLSEDIREVPAMLPPLVAEPIPPPKLLPTIQAPPPDAKISTGARKDKEVQPQVKTKDSK